MKLNNILKLNRYKGYWEFLLLTFRKTHKDARSSYSQTGEDLLVRSAFRFLRIKNPTYLDIGAHHPTHLSNTFLFYQNGAHGVCIEPDPQLVQLFRKKRPNDIVLECAIGLNIGETILHVISDKALSTTSPIQAEYFSGTSKHYVSKKIKVAVTTINQILNTYFSAKPPDFISIDIEGMDLSVLQSLNFKQYRPTVFCVETLTYDETKNIHKMPEIIDFMVSKEYFVFADTFLNTIFVDQHRWNMR